MIGRGEHAEIVAFVGQGVNSELSGNMIDVCPVGALTSKPFRYAASTWELSRRRSVSPHDSLGSNLIVQAKGDRVLRVVPFDNPAVNECWISDKDRFSYEGLASEDRLAAPMIKEAGEWKTVDWPTALELRRARAQGRRRHARRPRARDARVAACDAGGDGARRRRSRARSARTTSTSASARAISAATAMAPAFRGSACRSPSSIRSIARSSSAASCARTIRSLAQRLRHAARKGAEISLLHSVADDSRIRVAHSLVAVPSLLPQALAEIVVAAAKGAGKPVPPALARHRARGRGAGDRREPPFRQAHGDPARQLRRAASRKRRSSSRWRRRSPRSSARSSVA